jgi:hypothetical protein
MRFIRPVPVTEARLISSTVPETVALYNAGTTYAKGALVRSGTRIYESQAASNTGHALTEPAWWIDAYPTNRWAAFDNVNSTATVASQITFTIRPGELLDSIALLDVSAASVSVVAVSDASGEVYNQTFVLSNVEVEPDFWDWFFEPIRRSRVLVVHDIPLMPDLQITVTLHGDDQSLATFAMGNAWTLGETIYGARVGINDFSRKETDDFGNQILVQRAYSKRGNFTVWCDNDGDVVSDNAQMLSDYRATNLVWIGSEKFNATVIYGWARTWEAEIAYPTKSMFTLEIEGLT